MTKYGARANCLLAKRKTTSKPVSPRLFRGDTHLSIRRGCTRQRATASVTTAEKQSSPTTYEKWAPRISPGRVGRGSKGEPPAKWGFPFARAPPGGRPPLCPSVAVPSCSCPVRRHAIPQNPRVPFPALRQLHARNKSAPPFLHLHFSLVVFSQESRENLQKPLFFPQEM